MATFVNTIPRQGAEDPNAGVIAFRRLVKALTALYEAERDVVGLPAGDPAFDAWLRTAERCRAKVGDAAEKLAETGDGLAWGEIGHRVVLMLSEFDAKIYADHVLEIVELTSALLRTARMAPKLFKEVHALQFERAFMRILSLPDYCVAVEASVFVQNLDRAA